MTSTDFISRETLVGEFSKAVASESAGLFIGSGISAGSKVAGWTALLAPLAKSRLGITITDSDDLPLIAQHIVNSAIGNRGELIDAIAESQRRELSPNSYHAAIVRMNVSLLWTTNYDVLLEKAFATVPGTYVDVKTSDDSIGRPAAANRVEIIKVHGCINASPHNDIIITLEDYEDFAIRKPSFLQQLQHDLLTKSFLFLGYSYRDPNIANILVEARRLVGRATRPHYMVARNDGLESQRFYLWCRDLRRVGIQCHPITEFDELESILFDVSKQSRGRTVFITGSHQADSAPLFRTLGEGLARESKASTTSPIVLMDGQSEGVGRHVASAFAGLLLNTKTELSSHIKFFPNPYAVNPDFSNNEALLPMLMQFRLPLFRATRLVVVFNGGMGTKAEIELAHLLGCSIVPAPLKKDDLPYSLLQEHPDWFEELKDKSPEYHAKATRGKVTAQDILACVKDLLPEDIF